MIFQQIVNADALVKLISVIEKRLEYVPLNPILKMKYLITLSPMVKVLLMLTRTNNKPERMNSLRVIACALLKEYRDCSSSQQEEVADVAGSAASIMEYLILNYGRLSFNEDTASFTSSQTVDDILRLKNVLVEVIADKEFCLSLPAIMAQRECSLRIAGCVCRLLLCLLQTDMLCREPNTGTASVLDLLYPASSEPLVLNVIHLLERESAAVVSYKEDMIALMNEREWAIDVNIEQLIVQNACNVLLRMCINMEILVMLPMISIDTIQEAANAGLSRYLTSLNAWVQSLLQCSVSIAKVNRLLQLLLTSTRTLLDRYSGWQEANNAFHTLAIAVGFRQLVQGLEQLAAVTDEARILREENEILRTEIQKLMLPAQVTKDLLLF